ncbi:MAG: diaminopimelate epimerase [Acidobacteria bacterium]|nr:diaminopimelate epimerase [Acidobacteriota bacterium]MBV9145368.1 diaminopimelate epimerase [Acidobacteriota bacterium]MBV9437080.1 diaminopimelate epimerase [Acidobacteriota bacterium]
MSGLKFVKAEACGNDFLIVDAALMGADAAARTQRLCDRHRGIGADGVEWVTMHHDGAVEARLFNADGSEAEISGNGTRCVAAWTVEARGGSEVRVRTAAGEKECMLLRRDGNEFHFLTEMGHAEVIGEKTVAFSGVAATGVAISTGNPHFVELVEAFPSNWQARAAAIAASPQFPNGTNVEFVRIAGRNIVEFRIFERGAGETQSSGTGSCASAIAAIRAGKVVSPVEVRAPGGTQVVHWDGADALLLEGPARLVCRGEFLL